MVVGIVLLAAGALGAASLTRSAQAPAPSAPVTFSSFPTAQELASGGLVLTAPQGASTVAEGRAAEAAARVEMGAPVVESRFAHCADTTPRHVRLNEDCWAVSLDPTKVANPGGTPPGGPPAKPLKYVVVLVEPGTNKILDAQGGG